MDLSTFDREGLISIVTSMGMEEVDHLSREELVRLVKSLNGDDTSFDAGQEAPGQNDNDNDDDLATTDEPIRIVIDDATEFSQPMDVQSPILVTEVLAAAPSEQSGGGDAPTAEQESVLTDFIGITGAEVDAARHALEATGWDLHGALTLYLESVPSAASPIRPTTYPAPPVPQFPSSFNATQRMSEFMNQMHRMGMNQMHDDDEYYGHAENSPVRKDSFDEDGVRKPDPVRVQRLVVTRSISDGVDSMAALARAEDTTVDWLYEPPRHLYSHMSLEKTMEKAEAEGRWLLVNIQNHQEFASHLLNRDVWTDETVESLLHGSYLFWQRGHTSAQGATFMRMYKIEESQLPLIAVLHPSTGAVRLSWNGLISAEDLCATLVQFVDTNVLPSHPPARPMPAPAPTPAPAPAPAPEPSSATETAPSKAEVAARPAEPVETKEAPADVPPPDYGTVPDEPVDEADAIKISLKLPNKTIARRYRKSDLVKGLFALAVANCPECSSRKFELFTRYPVLNLGDHLASTVEQCGLANSQVAHRWI